MPMTSGQMRDAVGRYFESGNGLDLAPALVVSRRSDGT